MRQIASDVFVPIWGITWFMAAAALRSAINLIAVPSRKTGEAAAKLAHDMNEAGAQISRVPGIGDDLAKPFTASASQMNAIALQAQQQVDQIHTVGWVAAILVFAIPVALLIALWLPRRLNFRAESSAAQRFIDAQADMDLFALRALANLPMTQLARVSDDPVRAWRQGDQTVIAELASLELGRVGLRPPARLTRPSEAKSLTQ